MGRGGGGGGRGGGGRAGRGAGGGPPMGVADQFLAAAGIAPNPMQLGLDPVAQALVDGPAMVAKYGAINNSVLKTPQEMGMKVNAAHEVIANEVGAPQLPAKLLSESASMEKLRKAGFPMQQIAAIDDAGSLRQIATAIPEGSRVLGIPGIEGIGVDVGGGKVWRVQWNGTQSPVKSNDVGRHAVYPEWQKQFGKTWVEQKAKVQTVARDMSAEERVRGEIFLRASVKKNYKYIEQDRADIHAGNWGKYNNPDGTVSYAFLDPGAFPLKGGRVTNQGF